MKKRFRWILKTLLFGISFAIMFIIITTLLNVWTKLVITTTLKRCPDKEPTYQTSTILPSGDLKVLYLVEQPHTDNQ